MIRLLGRVCLILLAAGIIASGLYLLFNGSSTQTTSGGSEGQHLQDGSGHRRGPEFGEHRGGGLEGGSAAGWTGIATKLGLLAVITALVVVIQKLIGRKPQAMQRSNP